jgi:mono/diheme cytochrome c family protein
MRKLFLVPMLAALIATAPVGSVSCAAELNGPMSSGKKIEAPAAAPTPEAMRMGEAKPGFDVEKLFAGTCGWCHSNAGRTAGKGPKLMGTTLTDAEIIHRIKVGKPGAMPAFETAFNDEEIHAIVKYIRALRDEGAAK